MKKAISKILVSVMLLAMFAGVGTAFAEESCTVTMWLFPLGGDARAAEERAMYDRFIAEFESQNPGIKVDLQLVPWDNRETRMMTALAAGKGPDCVYLNPDILKLFALNQLVVPITQYVDKKTLSDFDQNVINQATIGGELYGIPCLIDIGVPCYNLDLLAKVGYSEENLPKTWDEFDALLGKLKEAGIYQQYSLGCISAYANAMFFSEGCDMIKEDGTVVIDNEAGMKVLQRLYDWYKKGYTPRDSSSVYDQDAGFLSGEIATTLSPDGSGFYVRKIGNAKFNWAPGPVLSGPGGTWAMSTCASIGVTSNCKNVAATVKWVEFFTSAKNNGEWNAWAGYFSPRKSAGNPIPDNKGVAMAYSFMNAVRGEPNHAASRQINPIFTSNMQAILNESVTVAEGAANMKAEMEALVANLEAMKPE